MAVLELLPLPPVVGTLLLVLLAVVFWPGAAAAATEPVSEAEAVRVAGRDSKVAEETERNGALAPVANKVDGKWEVAYFTGGEEVALVIVDPQSGEVTESWTGHQVAWKMARGYSGAFGHKLNAPYVFPPLCAIFLLGLIDWRRWRRVANLDLLVLLGFGVSHFFFNRAEIGVSVPLQYPVLLYLFGRALWIGFRGRGEALRPVWPVAWMLVAALFLMGVRVGLNLADSGAIDVGYASVVGADRITHGEPIYDNFPEDVSQGDTYGPVNYYAYVPSELIWPWSGSWDDLPAAHGGAVTFDIVTFGLLLLLGIRIRPGPAGRRLAAILAFGWAAYPYTAFALESNSNDSLVAMLLVATMVVLARPFARGALASLAAFAKFAPALLVPMLLTYEPGRATGEGGLRARSTSSTSLTGRRAWVAFGAGFVLVGVVVMLWPAIDPGLQTVYERTIGFQSGRDSPFSIWGQLPWLEPLRTFIVVGVAGLCLLLAFVPRRKSLVQVAALGAALLIGLQITMHHWFYLYIVWFYPLLLIAMAAREGGPVAGASSGEGAPGPSPG